MAKAREQQQEREVLKILEKQSVEAIEAARFRPWFNFTYLSAFAGQMRVAPAFLVKVSALPAPPNPAPRANFSPLAGQAVDGRHVS